MALRKVRGVQNDDLSGVLWRDQNEEQVQNVFKRVSFPPQLCSFIYFRSWFSRSSLILVLFFVFQFLFHYSKARNSVGAVQQESHSVHPLMRLSPKLSQRRKKKVVLLKIRSLPEGLL
uniref:Neuromedin-S-like n=1 Tax=Acanthochromis polyacanthus TaxID=80966 RepID=A0A3Q1GFE4_9TELE